MGKFIWKWENPILESCGRKIQWMDDRIKGILRKSSWIDCQHSGIKKEKTSGGRGGGISRFIIK